MDASEGNLEALRGWRGRFDVGVKVTGIVLAHAGIVAQVAGFALAFLWAEPTTGEAWLEGGFGLAGLGGAGIVYGIEVDAGGSIKKMGGPFTYELLARRGPS